MKKFFGFASFTVICFFLAFLNVNTSVIQKTPFFFTANHDSHKFQSSFFNHSNSEIELFSRHSITPYQGNHGGQKIPVNAILGTRFLGTIDAFSPSHNSLTGRFRVRKHLSHNYPSHNFW